MTIVGKIGLIGTYAIFLFMGIFGIYVGIYSIGHNSPNYMILLGGTGITIVILISIRDGYKKKNKRPSNIE